MILKGWTFGLTKRGAFALTIKATCTFCGAPCEFNHCEIFTSRDWTTNQSEIVGFLREEVFGHQNCEHCGIVQTFPRRTKLKLQRDILTLAQGEWVNSRKKPK